MWPFKKKRYGYYNLVDSKNNDEFLSHMLVKEIKRCGDFSLVKVIGCSLGYNARYKGIKHWVKQNEIKWQEDN